ncbi:GNAT family N-acetyltransferase [Inquilinus limosus]|uniref:GNAT family N-acetyltransferase n=1 Tax=Inquilinus limosus TaxID=171674 RepID=UPI001872FA7A|nr:GNAT family N-acetyltransferase [Inquilinus limosus]
MIDFTIRALQVADWPDVAEMQVQPRYRWGTLRLPFQSREEVRRRLESAPADDIHLAAVVGGRVVGRALLQPGKGRRAHTGAVTCGVHDDFHRQGIGTGLMAALLDTADNWLNLKRLELGVWTDNVPAIALYQKFGFEIEGCERAYAYRDGAYVDSYLMARLRGL